MQRTLEKGASRFDKALRKFHVRRGFEDLPFDPRRAMVVRMADLARSGIATGWTHTGTGIPAS